MDRMDQNTNYQRTLQNKLSITAQALSALLKGAMSLSLSGSGTDNKKYAIKEVSVVHILYQHIYYV